MKKLLAIVLVMAVLLSFAACERDEDPDPTKMRQTEPKTTKPEETEPEQTDPEETEPKETEPEETQPEETEPEETEPEFSLGQMADNVYENDFIGIGCKLDDSWQFATEEEILAMNNIVGDLMGEQVTEALKNATVIVDMTAYKNDQTSNISVNLEKASAAQLARLDLEKYYTSQIPLIESSFAQMGITDISFTTENKEIGGKEILCFLMETRFNGVTMYQTMFAIKCNGYMANIGISTFDEKELETLVDCFYFLSRPNL